MKKVFMLSLMTIYASIVNCQTITFKIQSPFITKEDKQDKNILIPVSIENATTQCKINFEIVEDQSSATKDRDFIITTKSPIDLDTANKYSSKIDLIIKPDNFNESMEEIRLKISFKDEKNKHQEFTYSVLIQDLNDGREDIPKYSEEEENKNRTISFDLFTGGNFDFWDALTIQKIGGELVINANNIFGNKSRLGFYTGIHNFLNFSSDSSSLTIQRQYIRVDTGTYVDGITKYLRNKFYYKNKRSVNQWGYYFNPTWRINTPKSDLFNIYASLHLEILRTATTTSYKIDTLRNLSDTVNIPLGENPPFQTKKEPSMPNRTSLKTYGYLGLSSPIWLNSRDKVKFHFDPGIGFALFRDIRLKQIDCSSMYTYEPYLACKPYYLFRFRASEQFTGLNVTIGGEVRGLLPIDYTTSIIVFLGIRADMAKWFKKA